MNKNLYIELFRFLACFGVIFIHIHPKDALASHIGSTFSLFCVPFFYYISFCFFAKNIHKPDILQKSVTRLFLPYFFWNLIYLFLRIYKEEVLHRHPDSLNIVHAILFGSTAEHLYFVPILIFVQSLAFGIFHLFKRDSIKDSFKKLTFVVVLIVAALTAENQKVWGWADILQQSLRIVVAGVLLLYLSKVQTKSVKVVITLSAILGLVFLFLYGSMFLKSNLTGFLVAVIAFAFPWQFPFPVLEKMSVLFYPVYLTHVFILDIFSFLCSFFLLTPLVLNTWQSSLYASIAFSLSVLLHFSLLKLFRFYRKLF